MSVNSLQFQVNESWLRCCGKPTSRTIFSVIGLDLRLPDNAGYQCVTVDFNGSPWVLDVRRGRFLRDGRVVPRPLADGTEYDPQAYAPGR